MMNLRSLVLGFAIVLAALPTAAESQTTDRLQMILDRGVLRVGTTMDTPVFSMRDPATGVLEGFDMDEDVVKEIEVSYILYLKNLCRVLMKSSHLMLMFLD